MKRKKLTLFGKILVCGVLACLLIVLFACLRPKTSAQAEQPVVEETPAATIVPTATPVPTVDPFIAEYEQNKAVNPEYIGKFSFESGMITENIAQSADNDKYLHVGWDGNPKMEGSVFLDYRNQLSDQNLILYGHYIYVNADAMFTPLERLLDQANYEANKYIDISCGPTDHRRYIITDVFYFVLANDALKYYMPSYTEEEFQTYYAQVKQADFYQTGETITSKDHWISLQTCVLGHDELREIVLAKQIEK